MCHCWFSLHVLITCDIEHLSLYIFIEIPSLMRCLLRLFLIFIFSSILIICLHIVEFKCSMHILSPLLDT